MSHARRVNRSFDRVGQAVSLVLALALSACGGGGQSSALPPASTIASGAPTSSGPSAPPANPAGPTNAPAPGTTTPPGSTTPASPPPSPAPSPNPAPAPSGSSPYLSPLPALPADTPPAEFTGTVYVDISGDDAMGDGSASAPYRTLAKAASVATWGKTIKLGAGTFVETKPALVAPGVSIQGAGQDATVLSSSGVELPAGISGSEADFKLWPHGALIQLISPGYRNPAQYNGKPADMIASADGRQTLSDFTIDGNAKSLKAGVWVLNRNNVTIHHVTLRDLKQRGAVFARSDMDWYVPLPDGMWMLNTKIHDCTFINSSADIGSESLGNLNIGGLDGAHIYNITIDENQGYGITFIYVGHFRNVKIYNAQITVPEIAPQWGEGISIELWNVSRGNEIFNINANTWMSIVNHPNMYDDVTTDKDNLWIHHVRMIDLDGKSGKEAIEVAAPGMTVSDSYFQDKGFGMAVWMQGKNHITIARNIIARPRNRDRSWAAEAGVFVPDTTTNLKIHNNVLDFAGTAIHMRGSFSNVSIRNNLMLNTVDQDLYSNGTNYVFTNNLKYSANGAPWKLEGATADSSNLLGDPGLRMTGPAWDTYYMPASAASLVVDKGIDVGLPYAGARPDIGRWEWGL